MKIANTLEFIYKLILESVSMIVSQKGEDKNHRIYENWRTTLMDPLISALFGREDDPALNKEAERVLGALEKIVQLPLSTFDQQRANVNKVAIYGYLRQTTQVVSLATEFANNKKNDGLFRSWALAIALDATLREIDEIRELSKDPRQTNSTDKLLYPLVQEARRLAASAQQADGECLLAIHNSMKAAIELDGLVDVSVQRLIGLPDPDSDTPLLVLDWMVRLGEEIKNEQPMRDIIETANPTWLVELDIIYKNRANKAVLEIRRRLEGQGRSTAKRKTALKAWVGLGTSLILLVVTAIARGQEVMGISGLSTGKVAIQSNWIAPLPPRQTLTKVHKDPQGIWILEPESTRQPFSRSNGSLSFSAIGGSLFSPIVVPLGEVRTGNTWPDKCDKNSLLGQYEVDPFKSQSLGTMKIEAIGGSRHSSNPNFAGFAEFKSAIGGS